MSETQTQAATSFTWTPPVYHPGLHVRFLWRGETVVEGDIVAVTTTYDDARQARHTYAVQRPGRKNIIITRHVTAADILEVLPDE